MSVRLETGDLLIFPGLYSGGNLEQTNNFFLNSWLSDMTDIKVQKCLKLKLRLPNPMLSEYKIHEYRFYH